MYLIFETNQYFFCWFPNRDPVDSRGNVLCMLEYRDTHSQQIWDTPNKFRCESSLCNLNCTYVLTVILSYVLFRSQPAAPSFYSIYSLINTCWSLLYLREVCFVAHLWRLGTVVKMLQFFNCTTLSCLIAGVYLTFTGYKMYQMMNPLSGIEVSGRYQHIVTLMSRRVLKNNLLATYIVELMYAF